MRAIDIPVGHERTVSSTKIPVIHERGKDVQIPVINVSSIEIPVAHEKTAGSIDMPVAHERAKDIQIPVVLEKTINDIQIPVIHELTGNPVKIPVFSKSMHDIEIPVIHETAAAYPFEIPVFLETGADLSKHPKSILTTPTNVRKLHEVFEEKSQFSKTTKSYHDSCQSIPNILESPINLGTHQGAQYSKSSSATEQPFDKVVIEMKNEFEKTFEPDSNSRRLERSERVHNLHNVHRNDSHCAADVQPVFGASSWHSSHPWSSSMTSQCSQQPFSGVSLCSTTSCPMYTAAVYSWSRTKPCVSTTPVIATTKGFHL
uniref:Uncharacterized protein n=1 Tax=Cacopsylla melanoneura TaxID=428564 RepID=A0A8D9ATC4_9HEMI